MKPDTPEKVNEQDAARVAYLIAGFIRQSITNAEHDELDEWISSSQHNQLLFEELTNPLLIPLNLASLEEPLEEQAFEKIKDQLSFSSKQTKGQKLRRIWYSSAAIITILLGAYFTYTLMNRNQTQSHPFAQIDSTLKPGGNYALLVLANGDTVNLSQVKNGLIDSTSGSDVMKTSEGQLSYENPESKMTAYHTLITPPGGQYSVTLPDGTRIWLNASTEIKYPVAFNGKERVVELHGEAYFEVAHIPSAHMPFIVNADGVEVEAIGTKFNINCYRDEREMTTTLLEGSVQVQSSPLITGKKITTYLKPGQQVRFIERNEEPDIISNVDVEYITAWRKGYFVFKDEPIDAIMRQVARWYGADVQFETPMNIRLTATIYRNEPADRLLDLLEATGKVHFVITGKKITVKP